MAERVRGTVVAAVAALVAVPLLGGGHGTLALWSDSVAATGTSLTTVTVTAPQVSCGSLGLDTVTVSWQPVPDATGYRVYLGPALLEETSADTTSATLAVAGTVTVRAVFGPWESAGSAPLAVSVLPPGCG